MSTNALAVDAPVIDPRYPIGKYKYETSFTDAQRQQLIATIADLPAKMRAAVTGLNDKQLDTPYRDVGWTVRQTVHHVADSHMNSFIRFRLGITENNPTIKPYHEELWADIADAKEPVAVSLILLDSLHRRMDVMLRSLTPDYWQRTVVHPQNGQMTLDKMLGLYAWHSRHHVAHITELRRRMGW
jgi:uncharacterized damage-inducible protein DinB